MRRFAFLAVFTLLPVIATADDEEPVFSGPQIGERLASFTARGVLGDSAGKEFDPIAKAAGKPIVLIFVHELNRPSVGALRLVMTYAEQQSKTGLNAAVVFLSDDATEMETRIKRAQHALPSQVPIGISTDGAEGPGAYGLNRNMTLTVLVGKQNKVSGNFALVQPSEKADVPRIVKAIAAAIGEENVPTLAELLVGQIARDEALAKTLAILLDPKSDRAAIDKAAEELDAHLAKNNESRQQLVQLVRRLDYGQMLDGINKSAGERLRKAAAKYNPRAARQNPRPNRDAPAVDLRALIGPLIRKNATPEQVDDVAADVEKEIAKNPAVRAAVGRATKAIVDNDKLANYGTERAQHHIKKWAEKYGEANRLPR